MMRIFMDMLVAVAAGLAVFIGLLLEGEMGNLYFALATFLSITALQK